VEKKELFHFPEIRSLKHNHDWIRFEHNLSSETFMDPKTFPCHNENFPSLVKSPSAENCIFSEM